MLTPPPGPSFFPMTLTVSLRGQPSAICYLQKKGKTKNQKTTNALESLLPFPHPKIGLPCFFLVFFSWYPSPSKKKTKQVIQNVCMFILPGVGERW